MRSLLLPESQCWSQNAQEQRPRRGRDQRAGGVPRSYLLPLFTLSPHSLTDSWDWRSGRPLAYFALMAEAGHVGDSLSCWKHLNIAWMAPHPPCHPFSSVLLSVTDDSCCILTWFPGTREFCGVTFIKALIFSWRLLPQAPPSINNTIPLGINGF